VEPPLEPIVTTETAAPAAAARSLVALLGDARARIVELLRREGEASVAELATALAISEVAIRRHLGILVDDGFVVARTVASERGRPPSHYTLTDAADQLFPQRYDQLATQMFAFLQQEHGPQGVRSFLRWKLDQEVAGLQEAVTAEHLHERLQQLAAVLSEAGFDASIDHDGSSFTLTQDHCTIAEVARDHPEVCAYEAATFSKVLGHDVALTRRETLAGGAPACVCHVSPRPQPTSGTNTVSSPATTPATSPAPPPAAPTGTTRPVPPADPTVPQPSAPDVHPRSTTDHVGDKP
jgi:predicted ArsR family transcriptional regulator